MAALGSPRPAPRHADCGPDPSPGQAEAPGAIVNHRGRSVETIDAAARAASATSSSMSTSAPRWRVRVGTPAGLADHARARVSMSRRHGLRGPPHDGPRRGEQRAKWPSASTACC